MRYYQARLHAEGLANRLTNLARVSVAMTTAGSETETLRVAGAGAAAIFNSPAALVVTRADGVQVAVVSAGPGGAIDIRPWPVELSEAPLGISSRDVRRPDWPDTDWPDSDLRVLAVRTRSDRPALRVVVPLQA